ncbi:MAG: SURF1 family protein [Pseudomonadota bacterium]
MKRLVFPLILGLGGAAILVSLGVWQVQRLAWKEGVLAEIEARIGDAPVALPAAPSPEGDRYLPVSVSGAFTGDELHVLASAKRLGPIYRVIAAFDAEDGRRILVDRGYISTGAKETARPAGTATVVGNLHWPDEVDAFTPDPDVSANIWYARDVPQMAVALTAEPIFVVVRETTENPPSVTPLPVDTSGIPNDHLEYAVTWFGLAVVWLAMTGYLIWRRLNEDAT